MNSGLQTSIDHAQLSSDADALLTSCGEWCIGLVVAAAMCALVWSLISRATRMRLS